MRVTMAVLGLVLLVGGCGGKKKGGAPGESPGATTAGPAALQLRARAAKLCARAKECACKTADQCAAQLQPIQDDIPEAMWSCFEGLAADCSALCDDARGQQCLQASASELQQNLVRNTPSRYCSRKQACGCPEPNCETAAAGWATETSSLKVMACISLLECKDTYADLSDPNSVSHQLCYLPVKNAQGLRAQCDPYQYVGRACTGGTQDCPSCSMTVCCDHPNRRDAPAGTAGVCRMASLCYFNP